MHSSVGFSAAAWSAPAGRDNRKTGTILDWGFAPLASAVDGFRLSGSGEPQLAGHFAAPRPPALGGPVPPGTPATLGGAVTPDGRWLLLADGGWGADVVSVAAAERGSRNPVIGQLSAGAGLAGATELAVSRDGRYVFISLQHVRRVEVYDLPAAIAGHFRGPDGSARSPPGPTPSDWRSLQTVDGCIRSAKEGAPRGPEPCP